MDPKNKKELLQKEIFVHQEEISLIEKKISTLKESLNDTPKSHPLYNPILIEIQESQIELDEIRVRILKLQDRLQE